MYDRKLSANVLKTLRNELKFKNGKSPSFKELSEDIEKKMGVYISHTSLWDYENPEKNKDMSIKNMVTLAEYYDVSYDYIIGKSKSRKRTNINVNKKYGLSDKVLHRFSILKNIQPKKYESHQIDILNELLENDEFYSLLETLAQSKWAYKIREAGLSLSESFKSEVLKTLTPNQIELCNEGKMILMDPVKFYDIIISSVQNTIIVITNDIASKD